MYNIPFSFKKEKPYNPKENICKNHRANFKAQTEIIIILALVMLSVVVIIASQTLLVKPEPSGLAQLKLSLRSDMERLMQSSGSEIVNKIGKQGGYLNPTVEYVNYGGEKVAYWGVCQNAFIPTLDQIANNIKTGLANKMNSLDVKDLQAKYGKEIKLNQITAQDVNVVIRENDIIADVYLPTFLEGFPLEMPYKITIPVNLGRIYNFASDFTKDNSKNRHFEKFIASLFYHANQRNFPTLGILGKCGDSIIRTAPELEKEAQKIVDFALSKTFLWEDPPPQADRKTLEDYLDTLDPEAKDLFLRAYENMTASMTESEKLDIRRYLEDQFIPGQPEDKRKYLEYFIPSVNNKKYQDLDTSFKRGAEVDRTNFQPPANPVALINSKPLYDLVPKCLFGFDLKYNLDMPIVTSVKSGDYEFNFAIYSSVESNQIGNCNYKGNFTEIEDPCGDKKCSAKIFVQDTNGKPIPNTKVSFGPCLAGLTDQKGVVEGKTVCGISEMVTYNPKYHYQYDVVSTSDLNKTVTLKKAPVLTVHFNKVNFASGYNDYWINSGYYATRVLKPNKKINYQLTNVKFNFDLKTEPGDIEPIFISFKPKNRRTWNPIEIFLTNGAPQLKIDGSETKLKEKYPLEINITKTYSDGKIESSLKEFEKEISFNDSEVLIAVEISADNTHSKDITKIEAEFSSKSNAFISGSNKTSISGAAFTAIVNGSSAKLTLSKPDLIKSDQSGQFSFNVLANISTITITEVGSESSNKTELIVENASKKGSSSIVIDYLPPDTYEVEIKTLKKVKFSKSILVDRGPFRSRKEISFGSDFVITGISRFDLEIKEDDKEIFINAFSPAIIQTDTMDFFDFDFSKMLPLAKKYCTNLYPITKSVPDKSCRFDHLIGSTKGVSLWRTICEQIPKWTFPIYHPTGGGSYVDICQEKILKSYDALTENLTE